MIPCVPRPSGDVGGVNVCMWGVGACVWGWDVCACVGVGSAFNAGCTGLTDCTKYPSPPPKVYCLFLKIILYHHHHN